MFNFSIQRLKGRLFERGWGQNRVQNISWRKINITIVQTPGYFHNIIHSGITRKCTFLQLLMSILTFFVYNFDHFILYVFLVTPLRIRMTD